VDTSVYRNAPKLTPSSHQRSPPGPRTSRADLVQRQHHRPDDREENDENERPDETVERDGTEALANPAIASAVSPVRRTTSNGGVTTKSILVRPGGTGAGHVVLRSYLIDNWPPDDIYMDTNHSHAGTQFEYWHGTPRLSIAIPLTPAITPGFFETGSYQT